MPTSPDRPITSSAHINLQGDHVGLVNEEKIRAGSKVRIVLYGTVSEVSEHAGDPMDQGGDGSASIGMDVSTVRLASNNDIAELFDEELDG